MTDSTPTNTPQRQQQLSINIKKFNYEDTKIMTMELERKQREI